MMKQRTEARTIISASSNFPSEINKKFDFAKISNEEGRDSELKDVIIQEID